jgi:hypothetical protein
MSKPKFATIIFLVLAIALVAGCERKVVVESTSPPPAQTSSCFTCHTDSYKHDHARLQWEYSLHGSGDTWLENRTAEGSSVCERCHTHEGFLAYVTGVQEDTTVFSRITCFTCHAPHTTGTLALRIDDPVALANAASYDKGESNVCVGCHQSRQNVTTYVVDNKNLTTRFGPHHSNQGDMLIGENAYEYANYDYENSAHSAVVADGCVQCHMAGSWGTKLGGHTFNMAHEVDEEEETNVADACNGSGCHGGLENFDRAASSDFDWDGAVEGVQTEVAGLLDSLKTHLVAAGLLNASTGLPTNNRIVTKADSSGAVFNYLFVEEDRSEGIHNTRYSVALLRSSINYLKHGNPNGSAVASDDRMPRLAMAH